ncbi:phosphoribosylamine--glycine ligase [Acidaminobacter hydrogenoformans]|uniref:Phosphoribosylamine--glycine ligase n=1 Tax=Acidaminobacter hydrogenoformans DSM 2784 TaxID=1120920 RepID=A0A1G5RX60_9FIRM|nr:phosphoribosylamine--glycine ligase [Acidaminobacter hydrogenoformans]SCZ78704.1 phosphoribosylamine--glycine ligase [Acidaminobacter hydrogenoformans DSM 2784]
MRILVIGNGSREHALGWRLSKSAHTPELFFAPGNFGTALVGKNVAIGVSEVETLVAFALEEKIDLTLVGPEVPLVAGVVDAFRKAGLAIIGPDQAGAQLEGSKAFSKEFMVRYGIPTAGYGVYTEVEAARAALRSYTLPVVIKADGLAAGKGVIIAQSYEEAEQTLTEMMLEGRFGDSGHKVVLEEFLKGFEASIICLVDGETILPLETAQDYKKIFDGDLGPNTGGMGSYSPSAFVDASLMAEIEARVLQPTLKGLQTEGFDFRGIMFIGLMIDEACPTGIADGIKVLEYNVRFGDPETQSLMARLDSDFVDVLFALNERRLGDLKLAWTSKAAVSVVLASDGYPDDFETGLEIDFPGAQTEFMPEVMAFFGGAVLKDGKAVTSGGRVVTVTALGETLESARKKAYQGAEMIRYGNKYCRSDIAKF